MPRDGVVCPACGDIEKPAECSRFNEHEIFSLEPCECGSGGVEEKEMPDDARKQMGRRLETVKREIEEELAKRQELVKVEASREKPVQIDEDKERLESIVADARKAADLEINHLRQVLGLEIKDAIADNAEITEVKELNVEMEGKLAMAIVRKAREVDGLKQRLEQEHRLRMVVAMEETQDAFRKPIERQVSGETGESQRSLESD
jgi:hypothetical protein